MDVNVPNEQETLLRAAAPYVHGAYCHRIGHTLATHLQAAQGVCRRQIHTNDATARSSYTLGSRQRRAPALAWARAGTRCNSDVTLAPLLRCGTCGGFTERIVDLRPLPLPQPVCSLERMHWTSRLSLCVPRGRFETWDGRPMHALQRSVGFGKRVGGVWRVKKWKKGGWSGCTLERPGDAAREGGAAHAAENRRRQKSARAPVHWST